MHKHHFIYVCLLSLLALPVGVMAKDSDWVVVTLYPSQGVYSANELSQLVPAVEGLWTLQDEKNRPFIRNIDSLATENTIVAQEDSVRFRRLIEQRELTDSGLATLKTIVNEHPVLQHRIADDAGESLNIWVKLKYDYNQKEQRLLLEKIISSLQTHYQTCTTSNKGPLTGMSLQSVDLEPVGNNPILTTFNQLSQTSLRYGKGALQHYSAADLLSALNDLMNPNQSIISSEQVEQLYMIAESVRSRHLHTLANPSFKRFKLIRIIENGADFLPLPEFNIIQSNSWSANESNYQILECRPEFLSTQNT